MRHAVGDRYRRARGRTAGDMTDFALPRALGRAEVRIDADPGIGELGHVGAANDDETGTAQPCHDRRIGFGRGRILQRARTGAGHLPPDIEQVLDRNRDAGIGRRRRLHLAQPVHRFGGLDRGLRVDMDKRPDAFAGGITNFRQAFIDQLAGAGAAARKIGRQ
jgi:hypothetical protein